MTELAARSGKYITLEEFVRGQKVNNQGRRRREEDDFDDQQKKKARYDATGRPLINSRRELVNKFHEQINFTSLNTKPAWKDLGTSP